MKPSAVPEPAPAVAAAAPPETGPAARLLRTSTFRVALLYVTLFGASVLVVMGFVYWATAGYVARQIDETIDAEITGLAEQYRRQGLEGLAGLIAERVRRNPEGRTIYLLVGPDRRRIVGNVDRWPQGSPDDDGWVEFALRVSDTPRGEAYTARARKFRLVGDYRLLVGQDLAERDRIAGVVRDALLWGLAITFALALAGALLMSRGTLRRIETINRTTRDIMAGDLARRVPESGAGDEFDELAHNLNAMLARIETLMAGFRQVSNDIAHDLRGPLTRLRNGLEAARAERDIGERHRARIDAAIEEADVLLATFEAILRIASIEAGTVQARFSNVDLAAIARDVAELYEPAAQEKGLGFAVDLAGAAGVRGDRHLLSQAIANLLDNAIKYTPAGGSVRVLVRAGRSGCTLAVEDSGPGIPEQFRAKVLERFYRLEESRTTPGSGLGLSLVAAVARIHGAVLELGENAPGLRVELTFPPAGSAAR